MASQCCLARAVRPLAQLQDPRDDVVDQHAWLAGEVDYAMSPQTTTQVELTVAVYLAIFLSFTLGVIFGVISVVAMYEWAAIHAG